jgi:spermidine synthase
VRSGSQESIYESGVLAASAPDRLSAEERIHLPMLVHPRPRRVLLLGGGLGGAVAEILKHPSVEAVDYVELDPKLIREARRAFGDDMTQGFDDPRVKVHYADARFFVKRATPGVPYDVVILGAPEPTTARLNRMYTAEFMSEAAAVLDEDGVFGLAAHSSENYISEELAAYLSSIKATVASAFPTVALYPGDPCHILATRGPNPLTRDADLLEARVEERGLDVVYIRDYYLRDRLSPERVSQLDDAVDAVPGALNTDLFPATYYLSMVLWNREFYGAPGLLTAVREFVGVRSASLVGAALLLLLTLPLARRRNRRSAAGRAVIAAVVVVGATEISLELTALLAFQSLYGYVYQQLAIIVASFMAGLAIGGWLGTSAVARGAGGRALVVIQLLITAVPMALAGALVRIAGLPAGPMETWASAFPLIVVLTALLAGAQFPVAVRLVSRGREAGSAGGRVYGADLFGAAVGAMLTSVLLLPIMGVAGTMLVFTVLNGAILVSLTLAVAAGGSAPR